MSGGDAGGLTEWLRGNSFALDSLDPTGPLDDLEPLRAIAEGARVVAVGENSHFIREFCLLRHRVLRFLVERCGFTVHAMEFGFSEGFAVDRWTRGEGADSDLDELLGPFPHPEEVRAALRWMRVYNRDAAIPVRFAGVDIPQAGGSLLPSLRPLKEYLSAADAAALPFLEPVIALAEGVEGPSMAAAAPRYGRLAKEQQDALMAGLGWLRGRLSALEPDHVARYGRDRHSLAERHLESAWRAVYNLGAMARFLAGQGLPGDMGVRDGFMADSVLWRLGRMDPDAKIALVAHNAHIQKTPIVYEGLRELPMGQRLAQALGEGYVSLGVTSAGGETAGLHPDEDAVHGFRVERAVLEPPAEGGIEAALAAAGVDLGFAGFHGAPRGAEDPARIRFDTAYLETSVLDAHDGVFHLPVSTVADDPSR